MTDKIKSISTLWADEPVLQAALHPDRQRKTTDYGIFLPLDEVAA